MIHTYITTKKHMNQVWNSEGKRHLVTVLSATDVVVTQVKTQEADGYAAIKVGIGSQIEKRIPHPQVAYYKKVGITKLPRSTRELKVEDPTKYAIGDVVSIDQVFEEGDIVNAQGRTKGRGFTGVIKRWGFAGGPRTHGQSDRERAPGSIGQGTDPGRVHKGKKMPGHYGDEIKTITNLIVLKVDTQNHEIWLSGAVPGSINSLVKITKVGKKKKFVGLPKEELAEESKPVEEATKPAEEKEAVAQKNTETAEPEIAAKAPKVEKKDTSEDKKEETK